MKLFEKYLQEYHEYLLLENKSPESIKSYFWCLGRFLLFIKNCSIDDIHAVRRDHIELFRRERYYAENRFGRRDSARSQNAYLWSIKGFFRYLKKVGYLVHNPSAEITYMKEPQKLPKAALTNTEMKRLLRQPDTGTVLGYRDRTILELLYSTGMRRLELLGLNTEDVQYTEGYVRINQGKGAQDRVVPLGKIACRYVAAYVQGVRPFIFGNEQTDAVFVSTKGNRLSKGQLGGLIRKYAVQSGIKKHITPHTFRRSCATEMIKNNANIMHVKELLGHRSMRAIQAYCNLAINDLKQAHRKYHPREKDHR